MHATSRRVWIRILSASCLAALIVALVGCGGAPEKRPQGRAGQNDVAGRPLEFSNTPAPGETIPPATNESASLPATAPGEARVIEFAAPAHAPREPIAAGPKPPKPAPPTSFDGRGWFVVKTRELEPLTSVIVDAAYSPDGARIFALCANGDLSVVDATSRETIQSTNPFGESLGVRGWSSNRAESLAIRPDGKQLAIYSGEKVHLFPIGDGPPATTIPSRNAVRGLQYTADGKRLFGGADDKFAMWDVDGGAVSHKLDSLELPYRDVCVSGDGEQFLYEREGVVTVHDVASGAVVKRFDEKFDDFDVACWSPDSTLLCVVCDVDGHNSIKVYEWPAGTLKHTRRIDQYVNRMRFLRDGRTLVVSGGGLVVFDAAAGEVRFQDVRLSEAEGGSVAVNPVRDELVLWKSLKTDRVRIYDFIASLEERRLTLPPAEEHRVFSLATSSDGSTIAGTDGEKICVWDAKTGAITSEFAHQYYGVGLTSDGARMLVHDSGLSLRDARTNAEVKQVEAFTPWLDFAPGTTELLGRVQVGDDYVLAFFDPLDPDKKRILEEAESLDSSQGAYSSDGASVAIANGGTIEVWDRATAKRKRRLSCDPRGVFGLAISPKGDYVAAVAASEARHVWLFDATSGERLMQWKPFDEDQHPTAVAFVGSKLIHASADGRLHVWDPRSAKLERSVLAHHGLIDALLPLGSAGEFLSYSSGFRERAIKIWNVATLERPSAADPTIVPPPPPRELALTTGRPEAVLRAGTRTDDAPVNLSAAAVSPDGRWLAAAGGLAWEIKDGLCSRRVCVWDARTLSLAHTFEDVPYEVVALAFSHDGENLAALCFEYEQPARLLGWSLAEGRTSAAKSKTIKDHSPDVERSFGPGGLIAEGESGGLMYWDARTLEGRPIGEASSNADFAYLSDDGKELLAVDEYGDLTRVDVVSGAPIWKTRLPAANRCAASSPDKSRIVVGVRVDAGDQIWLCDANTLEVRRKLTEWKDSIDDLAWSPDGRWIVAADGSPSLQIIDAETFRVVRRIATRRSVRRVFFANDSQSFVAFSDPELAVWRLDATLDLGPDERLARLDDLGFRVRDFDGLIDAHGYFDRPEQGVLLRELEGTPVESVELGDASRLGEDAFEPLLKLPRLRRVSLYGSQQTPAACLDDVLSLPRLESLSLAEVTPVGGWTPELMDKIVAAPRLSALSLSATLTPEAVEKLGAKTALTDLDVGETRLSSEAVRALGRLVNLESLDLGGCDLTGIDLSPLAACQKLRELDLSSAKLTDAQLAPLGELKQLRWLRMDNNPDLTDAALEPLTKLPSLQTIQLYGCEKITDAAVEKLKAGRKDLGVHR